MLELAHFLNCRVVELIHYESNPTVDAILTAFIRLRPNPLFRPQGLEQVQFLVEAVQ